jgi:serine/threonine protein kinase
MSENLADLLQKMLVKDPSKRLGHNSVEDIKKHPWFEKIKWEALMQRKYKAPFVPNLSSDIDTNNFDV